ncbi:MAG: hypothetical protein MUF04_14565 [Akkermansiaceae bacterium]|jgi:hypothetical protein|nr:hypothetical protein [Akkermansiaceae bacterium]
MKFISFCAVVLPLALVACKRGSDEIQVYRVSKDAASPPAADGDPHAGMPGTGAGADPHAGVPGMGGSDPHAGVPGMGGGDPHAAMHGPASTPPVTDEPPGHWEKTPGSRIRVASYLAKDGDKAVATISLSGLAAAPASRINGVNMWRETLGQAALAEADLATQPTVDTPFGQGVLVDVEGATGADGAARRLIGIIAEKDGTAWYFKMDGAAAVVAREKDHFMRWVGTVKPGAPQPAAPQPPAAGNQAAPPTPADAAADADKPLTWTAPDGWQPAEKARMGGYASFTRAGPDGTAQIAITHFPGDVGGPVANINRWRTQVGAEGEVTEADLPGLVKEIEAGPVKLSMVDCQGPENRLVAAWIRQGEDTWFFRLSGPTAAVEAEMARFTAFLRTIRFTSPE